MIGIVGVRLVEFEVSAALIADDIRRREIRRRGRIGSGAPGCSDVRSFADRYSSHGRLRSLCERRLEGTAPDFLSIAIGPVFTNIKILPRVLTPTYHVL